FVLRRLGFHFGRSLCLWCSLLLCLVIADRNDLEDRVLLTVALLAPVIVAPPLLEHRDLVALGLGDDLRRDSQAVGRFEAAAVAGEQHIAKRDPVTGVAVQLL